MVHVRLASGGVALSACLALCAQGTLAAAGEPPSEPPPAEVDLTEPASEPVIAEEEPSWLEAPSERRCGFAIGISAGANMGTVSGFPNDAVKIGRDEFEVDTGFSGGGSGILWVGLAPTDWIVFGGGFNYGRLASADHDTGFGAVAFHVDAFPLFGLGGPWREVGLTFEGGVGATTTTLRADDVDKAIDSGIASRLSAGLFYEGIRAWKVSMGPFVSYDGMWSPSAFQPTVWIGWRTALYAGP